MEHGGGALVRCSIEWLAGAGQGGAWQDDQNGEENQNHSVHVSHGDAGLSVRSTSILLVIVVLWICKKCVRIFKAKLSKNPVAHD